MADDIFLTGPLGTQWNIGSWVEKSAGVDFGAAQLVRQMYGQNAWAEGARLGFETAAGPRRMTFPLIVPSGGVAGLSLDTLEASLRQMVRPGGFVDLRLDGVPSSEMVRFDILGGDVSHRNYTVDTQRIDRRKYALSLDTQPFGYWPTWIIAGSVASVAINGPGKLALSAPLGDVPGLMELTIVPTAATQLASNAAGPEAWFPDGVAWANGARPSFIAGLFGGSFAQFQYTSTYNAVDVAPARMMTPTAIQVYAPGGIPGWVVPFVYTIPSAVEPAYRGRFRAFAQAYDNGGRPHNLAVDAIPGKQAALANTLAFASAAMYATLPATAGLAWPLLDLGEISLPPAASGVQSNQLLRVWTNLASGGTTTLWLDGLYLLPLDGQAGVLTRGLAAPSIGNATAQTVNAAAQFRGDMGVNGLVASDPIGDLTRYYRGVMPFYGATVQQLDLLSWQRKSGGASAAVDTYLGTRAYGAVSVRYRPRFQFLKGL